MFVRGIRGATTIESDCEQEILTSTSDLLLKIVEANRCQPSEICSVFITVTHDVTATFPARAIRQLAGWDLVPLMCSLEIPVDNSLPRCIRLMVLLNTDKAQDEIKHIYLKQAQSLRPDMVKLTHQ